MKPNNTIVKIQIAWALLCIVWNGYGLWLVTNGKNPVAPTASLTAASICLFFAGLFWLFYQKQLKHPYVLLSFLTALFAAYAVYGGFTQDRSLWASESWRWGGILLNGMGALAGFVATARAFKSA